jgi:hypothetical protein
MTQAGIWRLVPNAPLSQKARRRRDDQARYFTMPGHPLQDRIHPQPGSGLVPDSDGHVGRRVGAKRIAGFRISLRSAATLGDVQSRSPIVSFFDFGDGSWISVTPEGYFEGGIRPAVAAGDIPPT